jgi:hypothetical protein
MEVADSTGDMGSDPKEDVVRSATDKIEIQEDISNDSLGTQPDTGTKVPKKGRPFGTKRALKKGQENQTRNRDVTIAPVSNIIIFLFLLKESTYLSAYVVELIELIKIICITV